MKCTFITAWILAGITQTCAQEENSNSIIGKSKSASLLWGGVETSTTPYINTDTKDSNGVSLYIAPYLDYNHKSGLGVRVKSYALPGGTNPGFYVTAISPYFARYDGTVFPYVSYTRYIQHNNPSVPYSPIQNELYAHLRIKTNVVDPMAGIDFGFGNDEQENNKSVNDLNAFFALTHLFLQPNMGGNQTNSLGFRPSLQLNAGTDRYYTFLRSTKYISQNTKAKRIGYGRSGRNGGAGNGTTTSSGNEYIINEENTFNLRNVEVNLYLIYFWGNISFEPSGSLYFPLLGDNKTPYGYWQLNLNYWFN